ncbi:protein Z-dependent protease inhibitor [Aplochiton taeniatus]
MLRLLFLLTYGCAIVTVCQTQRPNITDLTFRNMDFAMNLYRKVASYHDDNIILSPLSISTAFATLSLAAGGRTREEILKGLNLNNLERDSQPELIPELFQHLMGNITRERSLKLEQGTAMFVGQQFEVKKTYSDKIKKFFDADITNVDFADSKGSALFVNDYIKRKTGGKINNLLTSIDPLTQLLLINTIFYQGDWQSPFNPNHTENGRFHVDNYKIVQVPMMFKEDRFYTMEDVPLGAKVLKLPYLNGVSMLILLPERDTDYTLIDDRITARRFRYWVKHLSKTKLELHMPKFKMEKSYSLHNILPDLGVSDVFSDSANLTMLSMEPGIKVSEVLHTTVLEVEETGTTAAAATSVGITAYSLPSTFVVDRPFFFFIYHEGTNNLLFMGRVIDPTNSS